jgi:squalene-associated FAD-dependent desaturase
MGVGHDGGSGMTLAGSRASVIVIGGGLAGISAAVGLADSGLDVTLLEARPWLGGATCSFARRGLTIDNGQHAFLRCFAAYRDLLARLGVTASCSLQDRLDLTVLGPDGTARLQRSGLPAPLHLARSLAGYRLLPATERAKVAAAAIALQVGGAGGRPDRSFGDWLARHGQDERTRRMVWDPLSLAALNVSPGRTDAGLAARVIRTALLAGRGNADLGIPSVPLSKLHGAPAAALLSQLRVTVRLGVRAVAVRASQASGFDVQLAYGHGADGHGGGTPPGVVREQVFENGPTEISAAGIVLAVPAWDAAALVPETLTADAAAWSGLEPSPVVSLHVIYSSRVTSLPFAGAVSAPLHWVVDKTAAAGLHAGQYLAATVRAADAYVDTPAAQLRAEFLPALERLFPAAADATVLDFFVTRERRATVAPSPGSRRLRPARDAGPAGFAVAGAWTDSDWPDTMEGAVRSGQSAARKLIADLRGRGGRAAVVASHGTGSPVVGSPVVGSPVVGSSIAGRSVAGNLVVGGPEVGSSVAGSSVAGRTAAGPGRATTESPAKPSAEVAEAEMTSAT